MTSPRKLGLTALAALALASPAAAQASLVQVGNARAEVSATSAVLANSRIAHVWSIGSGGQVLTTSLTDLAIGRNWSAAGSPDFQLALDSTSVSWKLVGVTAQRIPPDPARPDAGSGVEIVFRYGLASAPGLLELDRTWSLYPGAAVEGVTSTLVNHSAAAFRVGIYSLAELTSSDRTTAQVQTYHGGADWRQDFRVTSVQPRTFDVEGEVATFDAGKGAGWFFVAERRSGGMNRVGRDSNGRTWIGVDNARDVFDWGPLMSSPPGYNRQGNPIYPAPVRQRTLTPYGTLDLGRAYLGVYHGGGQQAAAAFVNDFDAHEMPAFARSVDLNTFHPWGHGSGLSDRNLRPQAALFKALGGETFMLDDQWQGSSAGDWRWDTSRFPMASNGVPAFVNYLHSLRLSLGLWMSPAEFNPSSSVYKQHPDWACTPTGDATSQIQDASGFGVWDMNNPALRAYLTSVIDRLIAKDGVKEFKFDYVVWVDCAPHDYLDYEDAYVDWVRGLEARHPHVSFELDETNDQRLWPMRSVALGPSWFDNGHLQGSTYPARLLHDLWSAAPWIPPSSIGFGTYDGTLSGRYTVDYLMPIGLLSHFTFWTDLSGLSRAQRAETAWWIRWYKANRSGLGGLAYEDTSTDPIDGRSWAAFQPWNGNRGYLFVFRQAGTGPVQRIALQGLQPSARYMVRNVRTRKLVGTFSGRALERGLTIRLLRSYSASVLSIVGRTAA